MREWITDENHIPFDGEEPRKYETTTENGKIKVREPCELTSVSVSKLMDTTLPPIQFIVDKILPVGLAMLAAPPKYGKSWLVLDLSIAVATGDYFLNYKCNKCDVLYLNLESSDNELQDRLKKVLGYKEAPKNFRYTLNAPDLNNGLLEALSLEIGKYPEIKLIIVDTFQKIKPPSKSKKDYEEAYEINSKLGNFAKENNICILLVHHLRKKSINDSDPFERIHGSQGLTGSLDTIMVITGDRKEKEKELNITGRNVGLKDITIEFDNCKWQSLGDTEAYEEMKKQKEYESHPAIITLKKKLEEIEQNPDEPIKEYITTMGNFRNEVIEVAGELVGTSERKFAETLRGFKSLLLKDGIKHIEPTRNTTYKGITARFHRYMYISK